MALAELSTQTKHVYTVKNPHKALVRDLNHLIGLKAVSAKKLPEDRGFMLSIRLDWPMQITETEFFKRVKEMPKGKVYGFLSS